MARGSPWWPPLCCAELFRNTVMVAVVDSPITHRRGFVTRSLSGQAGPGGVLVQGNWASRTSRWGPGRTPSTSHDHPRPIGRPAICLYACTMAGRERPSVETGVEKLPVRARGQGARVHGPRQRRTTTGGRGRPRAMRKGNKRRRAGASCATCSGAGQLAALAAGSEQQRQIPDTAGCPWSASRGL